MTDGKMRIGMIGLGVMGRNLLLNMAEHGYACAGYDKDAQKVSLLQAEAGSLPIRAAGSLADFLVLLQKPRVVILLVPAGPIVDSVIGDLLPSLEPGDLIIDSGNSHFTDTNVRQEMLEAKGLSFFGMGISGGEAGARHGPSMMPGGPEKSYEIVRDVLEATAAKVNGEPCVAYMGPGSAGHYVKMVHNGIEYAIMQLIAETYDLLSRGLDFSNDELADVFQEWNQAELGGYLVEITAEIFRKVDDQTGKHLVDVVLDAARQLGTGMWTSQDALALNVPTPTIDSSVAERNLSGRQMERNAISHRFGGSAGTYSGDRKAMLEHVRGSLYAAMILSYAQGFSQLSAASMAYKYNLDLATVASIWRGGCIIRSRLLEPIRQAYQKQADLVNLVLDPNIGDMVNKHLEDLSAVVQMAAGLSIPAPAFMASLAYIDSLRSSHLPANLIQAQRDYFGAHTYERVDQRGVFHTEWSKE